ncbi:MAG: methyltransferase domain-containing protein [Deltaproteobacteria bacterium]
MPSSKYPIRWSIVIAAALIVGLLFFWETSHLKIETDILKSLPHHDPVLASARRVISHLPIQDKIFIDLEQQSDDRDKLVRAASLITDKLNRSGLFTKVGISDEAQNFPELIAHVNTNLPSLLSASDLEQKIGPLIAPDKIREAMAQNRQALAELEGIGRADMIAKDPLGMSYVILGQMSALLPANKAQFHSGQLLSADGRHALIIARIAGSGTDTSRAARIEKLLLDCRETLAANAELNERYILTSVGAYRAALDNETTAKRDTRLAVILTTLGIALLLILAFPRPLIGLLALLPSTVGAIAALFVCSFIFPSMSMLAVGFGGAIMAFTVDLGLTYLLFLDQPQETYGDRVAREVWSAELTGVLTTVGAFLLLLISDFKILAEIGVFAALGVTFAFIFVHVVFPRIFPALPPSRRRPSRYLRTAVDKMAAPAKWKLAAAVVFGLIMLLFAKPVFNVDLQAMNSVSPETIASENKLQEIWGNLSGKCYVLLSASTLEQLQKKNEQLMTFLAADVRKEKLAPAFLPSVLFPSPSSAQSNLAAWRGFWNKERVAAVKRDLDAAARENGFAPDAFQPFWKIIHQEAAGTFEIPRQYFEMLGIAETTAGYTQLSLLSAGKNYQAEEFFGRLTPTGLASLFDADLFSKRLGEFLKSLFLEVALIISIGLVLVIFLFFLDWRLSLSVLAPVVFALAATLGTLKIIGHPLDIPGIMLWIVIMGMGIDYAIYYVCTYQRHPDERSPAVNTVKLSIFLAAATTLIGFGVLALAKHSLLKSIGLVSLLGIGYSLIGTYFIVPMLMQKVFAPFRFPTGDIQIGSREHLRRTILRYRHLPGYPRIFARFKIMMDPMFRELHQYVQNPRRMIDIGCGYGVPATWLLEIYPQAQVFGLEPDGERVLIAGRAIGGRGFVQAGLAPDLPAVDGTVDYVTMLDMLHYVDDEALQLVLRRIHEKLEEGGTLLIRATVPSDRKVPWKRWIEVLHLKLIRTPQRFRRESEIAGFMTAAGFNVRVQASPAAGVEEKWFVGKK